MRFILISIGCLFFLAPTVASQISGDSVTVKVKPLKITKIASLFFSQSSFSNYWKGGGANTLAIGSKFDLIANYKKDKTKVNYSLKTRYGIIKHEKNHFVKNDDQIVLDIKFDRSFSKALSLSGIFNFRTRFHDTYKINKDGSQGILIGNFMAPGYFNLGTGIDYKPPKSFFSIFYTPVNSKITVVADSLLAYQFLPKKFAQKKVRYEIGSLVRVVINKEIMKNVFFQTMADFFTNHVHSFGKFDINWENKIRFVINKYVSANILTQLVYDEDILFNLVDDEGIPTGEKGARTQFREALNIGLTHKF